MAKKKPKSKLKKVTKLQPAAVCSGLCIYEDGILVDHICSGPCEPCPLTPFSSNNSLTDDPPVLEMYPCNPRTLSATRSNCEAHQLICERLANGDIIYACLFKFNKSQTKRKAKRKAKKKAKK